MEKLSNIVKEAVGNTSDDLSLDACAYGECPLGDIIADSFLDKVANLKRSLKVLKNVLELWKINDFNTAIEGDVLVFIFGF